MTVFQKRGNCGLKAGSLVAKGTHTTVFKHRIAADAEAAIPIPEATAVAVKEYVLPSCSGSADAKEVQVSVLSSFVDDLVDRVINNVKPHKNICRLYGVEAVDAKSGGGLDRLLLTWGWVEKMERTKAELHAPMPEQDVRKIAREITQAIAHLHEHGVSHDDLRPQNVLLTRDHEANAPTAVVTDYAIVKRVQELLDPESGNATTKQKPNYCAPEVFTNGGEYDAFKVDVWSIGATVLEMLSGKMPFSELDPSGKGNIMFKIIQGRTPSKYPEGLSGECVGFLNACFERNFDARPEAASLLEHPWLS